jgi:serine/threonine protein kinase/peptidoglycan hydrolase-like protein with peptidoglycan-binding domain
MSEANEEAEQGKGSPLRGVLPAGTTLRGYELISILGQGAFGITYRARDLTLGRDVAIKEYLPATLALREGRTTVLPRSPEHAEQFAWGRERFLDEARTLARLDRSAIVRVYDFLEANGTAYMVMALIEGETLNKRLMRDQRLTPEAVERLIFPLLDGLEAVHAIGFLHRDIKPANIMVDDQGRPTLIDFGAARAAMVGRSTTMTAIFTPGYAAPEQFITNAKLGPWSDIYGVAATLYHAITGRIPPSAIDRIVDDAYEPLSELRPEGFVPELLAGIDAGMVTRAINRPRSIAEWRGMLRSGEWLASDKATRVTHKPGRLARAASRSRQARLTIRGPVLWSAAAAAILVLAGAGWLAWQANAPGTVGAAALSLSAEQLEQALAERRKADALAAEKRKLEDEARSKAAAETEAKRQAEAELEQARQARQKAEDELAQLKADIEARRQAETGRQDQGAAVAQRATEDEAKRKAEAEAASLRQAEEEAAKRAAADAEAKRQADEALVRAEAERQRADADARAKAETAARRQTEDEAQRKAAADAASKRQADEVQAKAQAEREKADAEAKAKAEAETAEKGLRLESADRERLQVALTSLGFDTRGSDGLFGTRSREMIAAWQKKAGAPATGFLTAAQRQALLKEAAAALSKYDEQKLAEEQKKAEERKKAEDEAKARASAAAAPGPSQPNVARAAPAGPAAPPDGLWRGTYSCLQSTLPGSTAALQRNPEFTASLDMQLANGSGSWKSSSPTSSNGFTQEIRVSAGPTGSAVTRIHSGQSYMGGNQAGLSGQYDGNAIRASGSEKGTGRYCTFVLTRA